MGEAADPDDIAHALTEESTPDDDLGSAASLLGAIAHAPGAPVLLRPGQVLAGKYRIARMLGQGGMGVVYLARDTRLDREVAVKLGTALTRSALARLEREAQALAKLSHPNVVVVHEVGEVDGRSFIAMEHVAGGTARTWVAAQPRTWREIVAVYLAAGEGISMRSAPRCGRRSTVSATPAPTRRRRSGSRATSSPRSAVGSPPIARRAGPSSRRSSPRRDPARRVRNLALGGTLAAGIAAAIAVPLALRSPPADPCAGGPAELARAWSPARAEEVRAGLTDPAQPRTGAIATRAVAALDAWSKRWVVQHRAACEAAWSPALRDRGAQCLARRRGELTAVRDLLAHPAPETAARADDIVDSLAPPETCADAAYLGAQVAPPTDHRVAAAAAALDPLVSRVDALIAANRHDEAKLLAGMLVPLAHATGYAPLIARSRAALGSALTVRQEYAAALPALTDAYYQARDALDATTAAATAARATKVLKAVGRSKEAESWARLASAEAKVAADPRVAVVALDARAMIADANADLPAALDFANQAVAAARALGDPTLLAQVLDRRSDIFDSRGERTAGIADLQEVMAIIRKAFGDDHYFLIQLGADLSYAQRMTGHAGEAATTARAAIALADTIFGREHRIALFALSDLAIALAADGHPADALPIWDRILAYDDKFLGDVDDHAGNLVNASLVMMAVGHHADALAAQTRALAILHKIEGPPIEIAITEGDAAEALVHLGRFDEAEAAASRALAIYDAHPGQTSLPFALIARGRARLCRHALAGARDDLARALQLQDKPDADPAPRAEAQLYLAEAELALGDRAHARTHAAAALAVYQQAGDREKMTHAEDLLRTLGPP